MIIITVIVSKMVLYWFGLGFDSAYKLSLWVGEPNLEMALVWFAWEAAGIQRMLAFHFFTMKSHKPHICILQVVAFQ